MRAFAAVVKTVFNGLKQVESVVFAADRYGILAECCTKIVGKCSFISKFAGWDIEN